MLYICIPKFARIFLTAGPKFLSEWTHSIIKQESKTYFYNILKHYTVYSAFTILDSGAQCNKVIEFKLSLLHNMMQHFGNVHWS